jgi:hypothetical protein
MEHHGRIKYMNILNHQSMKNNAIENTLISMFVSIIVSYIYALKFLSFVRSDVLLVFDPSELIHSKIVAFIAMFVFSFLAYFKTIKKGYFCSIISFVFITYLCSLFYYEETNALFDFAIKVSSTGLFLSIILFIISIRWHILLEKQDK